MRSWKIRTVLGTCIVRCASKSGAKVFIKRTEGVRALECALATARDLEEFNVVEATFDEAARELYPASQHAGSGCQVRPV